MKDLVPYHLGQSMPSRVERQVGRALTNIRADQVVVVARETARIEAIADISRAALFEASQVSEVEFFLSERSPHANARLKTIADMGCAAMAEVVLRAGRR